MIFLLLKWPLCFSHDQVEGEHWRKQKRSVTLQVLIRIVNYNGKLFQTLLWSVHRHITSLHEDDLCVVSLYHVQVLQDIGNMYTLLWYWSDKQYINENELAIIQYLYNLSFPIYLYICMQGNVLAILVISVHHGISTHEAGSCCTVVVFLITCKWQLGINKVSVHNKCPVCTHYLSDIGYRNVTLLVRHLRHY